MKLLALLLSIALSLVHNAAAGWQDALLQNDLLAAASWALFGIDPYNFLDHKNETNGVSSVTSNDDLPQQLKERLQDLDAAINTTTTIGVKGEKRQLITFQGLRPKIKSSIRVLKGKLLEIHDGTYLVMFLGITASNYIDDPFHFKSRSREDSFLYAFEDLVSLLGVDGPSCVHRLLCDLGSTPALKTNGLFAELADLTIRHILTEEYTGSSFETNSIADDTKEDGRKLEENDILLSSSAEGDGGPALPGSSSYVSYLDAVAAGRHGADCAHTFDQCPISLISMLQLFSGYNQ